MKGSQSPRIRFSPKWESTGGADAAFLAESYGLIPDPWQQLVLDDWLGEDRRGRLAAGSVALAVPRQNGKNAILEIVELFKMVLQGRRILHTAHEVKTARKAFQRICSFFENERKYPELAELVKEIRRTNGQEAILLHEASCSRGGGCDCKGGGSVEFVARSRGSGRGYTVDDLVCDEAQELTDEQLEALLPTIASAPSGDPQQLYTGTPPTPRSVGEVFPRIRAQALGGKAKRLCWIEWSIPDEVSAEEAMRAWKENAYSTNPALGGRLNIQTVTDERAAMSPEGFCRERYGRWDPEDSGAKPLDFKRWQALQITPDAAPTEGRVVYGVKFSVDGSEVALSAARKPVGAKVIHVEGIKSAPMSDGTGWLVEWLAERATTAAQIVIDGKSGSGALATDLRDAGVRSPKVLIIPTLDQIVTAHAMLKQATIDGSLSHVGQETLDGQVREATRRKIGQTGSFGWQAPQDGSVCTLDSVTLAHWGAATTKRNPGGSKSTRATGRTARGRTPVGRGGR